MTIADECYEELRKLRAELKRVTVERDGFLAATRALLPADVGEVVWEDRTTTCSKATWSGDPATVDLEALIPISQDPDVDWRSGSWRGLVRAGDVTVVVEALPSRDAAKAACVAMLRAVLQVRTP